MKYFFGLSLYLILASSGLAQFYEFGQDPASLKWKSLDTEHFRIIFPSDFSDNSQRFALLMEKSYKANSEKLNHQPSRIPVIIHNQTTYSNAFVTWAPKRMEFFTFPDPGQFPIDWLKELSLHEYRHVVQVDKLNQGLTHVLSLILGQQATGGVAGVMPLWFIEGDAVTAETSLSQSGRGRLPSFEMELKAQLLSGNKLYSLSKAYLGSYRDFVPDYYRVGYQMVSFARKCYGDDYWTSALEYVASKPFLLSPYHFYSKKITGEGQNFLYRNTMDFLKDHWIKTSGIRKPDLLPALNKRISNIYTSYLHPRILSDSSVIALKMGLDIIPRFVKINTRGEEDLVFVPGSLVSGRFSIHDEKIIWDEYVQDIRWKNRSYSILKEFNLKTHKSRNISWKSKFLSPSWSPNGDSIVAVNADTDYKFSLIILNPVDGHIIKNIPSPDNCYIQYPEWIKGTGKIAAILTGESGKSVFIYDLVSDSWTEILKTGFVNIDQLQSVGDFLFFSGGFTGIDEIFSYNFIDKKLRKYSNSPYGAFHPDVSEEKGIITYSTYGLRGYDIIIKSFDPSQQEEFFVPDTINEQTYSSVDFKPDTSSTLSGDTRNLPFAVKPYNKSSHLFNFHSWAPYWFDYSDPNIDNPKVSAGITLLSQNELSTAFTTLGYERSNHTNYFHSRFSYKGFVPVIEISTNYGGISEVAADTLLPDLIHNLYSTISTYIPLSFTSGKVITGMQAMLQLKYRSTYYPHYSDNMYKSGITFFEPELYFYSYLRTTARDLQPRLGFVFDAKITSAPFENELYGNISSLRINLYLPGLIKNQGLKLKSEWQNQNVDSYYFPNHLALPRGYIPRYFVKMNKYSADYAFPVMYPDLSVGSLLYLKRIRADLFADYMMGLEKYQKLGGNLVLTEPEYPLSQGLELYVDYHILRFIVEFSSGARFVYFPREKTYGIQMLFAVNLDKF